MGYCFYVSSWGMKISPPYSSSKMNNSFTSSIFFSWAFMNKMPLRLLKNRIISSFLICSALLDFLYLYWSLLFKDIFISLACTSQFENCMRLKYSNCWESIFWHHRNSLNFSMGVICFLCRNYLRLPIYYSFFLPLISSLFMVIYFPWSCFRSFNFIM